MRCLWTSEPAQARGVRAGARLGRFNSRRPGTAPARHSAARLGLTDRQPTAPDSLLRPSRVRTLLCRACIRLK